MCRSAAAPNSASEDIGRYLSFSYQESRPWASLSQVTFGKWARNREIPTRRVRVVALIAIIDVCAHLQPTMGSLVSKAKLFLYATIQLGKTYDVLRKRIETSPGVPVDNPTLPLWTVPRAQIPVDETGLFPQHVDVVIIGSGITGTSFAYNALSREAGLKIVMLEARDVCSGATGR